MKSATFNKFRKVIHDTCGISLGPNKTVMVSSRIARRIRALGLASHEEYYRFLQQDSEEISHLVDAISTNVTSFFRDAHQFDFLSELAGKWARERGSRIRIWSAASSTGEEPYSIAMALLEGVADAGADIRILATDISTRVLAQCREGIYERKKIDGVPPALLKRYFNADRSKGETRYAVKDELKRTIKFLRLNLLEMPYSMKGPFDAIFCRNVMIYFDNDLRRGLMDEFTRLLRPGGHLFVGSSEGLVGSLCDFKMVRPSTYRRP